MRTSKKFLSMILAIMMVVGALSAAASSYAFDDVEDYQSEIALMSELGIVVGKTETEFGYGADIERWQMALFIARMMTGKVYNDYVNWYETENYTTFQDINYDQAMGAISYGNDNGIIKGYSETEFGPTDGITIQDAFTMAVRMLGYGSSAMDATYPWSYVDKAIKLDLDALLPLDYNNEDIATKEQIVAILYQALFAPKADGTTIGASKFNLTMDTVVITGTKRGNLFTDAANPDKVAADGSNYVTFNLLKDDGTIQSNPSYYLPRTAFKALGADNLSATLKIGYSYDVVTKDDYTTLLYAKENDTVVVDQEALKGGDKDHRQNVTINSDAYKAVVSYSTLGNGQGTKTTNDYEVILYKLGDNAAIGSGAYLRDINLNIVDKDGKVILTYIPHFLTGATTAYPTGTYMVELTDKDGKGTGVYRDPVEADWIKAAEAAVWNVAGVTLYQAIIDTYVDITNVNAYSDTILIDDDGDSDYDRGIYIGYSFGYISTVDKDDAKQLKSDGIPGDGRLEAAKTAYTDVAYIDIDKYFNGDEDYVIKAEDVLNKYCLYAYNSKTNVFYLKDTYETKIGYVTTVNKPAKTITFDQVYFGYNAGNITGTTYSVGVETLPGGTYNNVLRSYTDFDTLKGRTVNYVLDEKYSSILRIVNYGDDAGYVVIKDSVASLNTNGYANVLAYVNSNVASVITVASVDGYTNVTGASMVNWYLKSGDLFKATKDALGMYHLTYIAPNQFTYYAKDYNLDALGLNFTNGVSYTDTQALQTLQLDENGKPFTQATSVNYDNSKGVSVPFSNFATTKDTVIILVNEYEWMNTETTFTRTQIVDNGLLPTLNFETTKGVPADGSHITLMNAFDRDNPDFNQRNAGARIFADVDGDGNAKFVYVVNGTWGGNIAINPSNSASYLDSNNTIIFVDKNTMETMVATNQTSTGLGVSVGTVYQYTNAIDFIRGGLTSAYTTALYNQRLYAGHFYYVKDGYVVGEAYVGATDQNEPMNRNGQYDIEVVKVSYIDKFVSVYTQWNGDVGTGAGSVGDPIWATAFGKPIVYELNDVTVTYKDGAPKDIVDDFAKIVNADNSFATAYVYTGNLSGVRYSGQKKLFITTAYSKLGDILTTKTIKNLGLTLGHCNIVDTEDDNKYIGMAFEINAEQYAKLSYFGHGYNDIANDQYAGIDNTLKLYDITNKTVKSISGHDINTLIYQGIGNRYYLEIFTDVKLTDVTHTVPDDPKTLEAGEYWLVWTNPENTNETFKLHLCGNNRDISNDNRGIIWDLTGLWIDPPYAEVDKGSTVELTAEFATIPAWINPDDIEFTWTSNNEGIATVDENGVVTGVAAGKAIITVEAWGYTADCEIVVVVPATDITIEDKDGNDVTDGALILGLDEENGTNELKATLDPEDTTDTVTWSSSDDSIVTVDENGKVTAVADGTATITATANDDVSATVEIQVIDIAEKDEPEVSAEITIKVDEEKPLEVIKDVDPADVSWTVAPSDIASVSVDGVVKGLKVGLATITAKYTNADGVKGTTIITVNVIAKDAE